MIESRSRAILTAAVCSMVALFLTAGGCEEIQPEPSVVKLIGDLNDTLETSQPARQKLMEKGDAAVPDLVQQVTSWRGDKKDKTKQDAAALRAARSLRLLGDMRSPAATGVVVTLLTEVQPAPTDIESPRRVLLSEAVRYAMVQIDNAKVRQALDTFITERQDAWQLPAVYLRGLSAWNVGAVGEKYTEYSKAGWHLARDYPQYIADAGRVWTEYQRIAGSGAVWVNVIGPLERMVEQKTPGTSAILAKILTGLPSVCGASTESLHSDGFRPWKILYSPMAPIEGADSASAVSLARSLDIPEPQAEQMIRLTRPRLVVMDWLVELNAGPEAEPAIRALLSSDQADERAKALETLQKLGMAGS